MTIRREKEEKSQKVVAQVVILHEHLRESGATLQQEMCVTRFLRIELWRFDLKTTVVIFKWYGSYGLLKSYAVYFEHRMSLDNCLDKFAKLGRGVLHNKTNTLSQAAQTAKEGTHT